MSFVNLHQHTHYSLLDGFGSPETVVLRAKELGYPAIAMTDHGVLYGAVEFYKAAKKHGIKPIIGCEVYVARRTRFDRDSKLDSRPYHMTLLAFNNQGYQNLMKLVTKANLEGFYYKPRIDYGLLKTYHEGIIALSGCLTSHLARTILEGDMEKAKEVALMQQDIFGKENYYLEIQHHPQIPEQGTVNEGKKALSKELGIPLVATTDSHYPCCTDAEAHDILICMQTQSTVGDEKRMKFTGDFSLKSFEEMSKMFPDVPEALSNTVKIAERCNIELEFGRDLIPTFTTPNGQSVEDYLRELCMEGMKDRYGDPIPKEAQERLDYELGIVNEMGFAGYFLIVWDFIRFAKDQGIVVGPGRGSAAGAIITYSLKITELDPLKYGLLFERFLNPQRIEMPDIDIDFADNRRDEVLNYVIDKYGRENVAQIITFGTMSAKAAVRDVGRSLGYSYADVDTIAKLVPPPVLGKHFPLAESIENDPDFKKEYQTNPRAKTLIDLAIQLEGTVRHAGTHACAVVISEKPLVEYTPLQRPTGSDDGLLTQYSMKPIGEIGLLKMDFLGLKNLTVLDNALKTIKRTKGVEIDLLKIPLDDEATFKLVQAGNTTGVFQFESAGMRRYLKELKPNQFEDIIAMGALYRPGPMEWIPMYIKGKHDPSTVEYLHESMEPILKETYGVAVYQEQILQIARSFSGFTLGEADILRKAVGKKDPVLLKEQREKFITGAVEKGHKQKFAEEVFKKVIEPFAGYGFNKAHAACYGLISYQTAYLKANYPAEFMSALMSADFGTTDKVVIEIEDCEDMGIEILPPDVNDSFGGFTVINDMTIRFGLMAIKGVGEGPVREIIAARNAAAPFASLEDFAKRVPAKLLNKKVIRALAYSGALDRFGDRHQIAENYEVISKYSKHCQETAVDGQTDIFGALVDAGHDIQDVELTLGKIKEMPRLELLQMEKAVLGMYVSSHPLQGLSRYIRQKANLIGGLTEKQVGKTITLCGLVMSTKKLLTRAGKYMMYLGIEDTSARIDAAVFPRPYQQFAQHLVEGNMVKATGKLDMRRGEFQFLINSVAPVSLETMIRNSKEANLFDPDEKVTRQVHAIKTDESDKKPNIIELSDKTDPAKLAEVKNLLLANKGDEKVEIHIGDAQQRRRIKVPFGVSFSDSLKKELAALVSGN